MGWTGTHKPKEQTAIDYFKEEFRNESNHEIIDAAMVGFSHVVLAIKNKRFDYVYALVILTRYYKGRENFLYKEMDEFSGPYVPCPKKILKLLTPIEEIAKKTGNDMEYYQDAIKWREASAKKTPSIHDGDIIKLEEPVRFSNKESYTYFKMLGRKFYAIFNPNDFNTLIRVRFNPRKHKFTIFKRAKEVK